LESILRKTTETGDIGLFSFSIGSARNTSALHNQTRPRQEGVTGKGEDESAAARSFSAVDAERPDTTDDRRSLPSYRDSTSEAISLYGSDSVASGSRSFGHPSHRGYRRSCSMTSYSSRCPLIPGPMGAVNKVRLGSSQHTSLGSYDGTIPEQHYQPLPQSPRGDSGSGDLPYTQPTLRRDRARGWLGCDRSEPSQRTLSMASTASMDERSSPWSPPSGGSFWGYPSTIVYHRSLEDIGYGLDDAPTAPGSPSLRQTGLPGTWYADVSD
jgi:hypothetical protein